MDGVLQQLCVTCTLNQDNGEIVGRNEDNLLLLCFIEMCNIRKRYLDTTQLSLIYYNLL